MRDRNCLDYSETQAAATSYASTRIVGAPEGVEYKNIIDFNRDFIGRDALVQRANN